MHAPRVLDEQRSESLQQQPVVGHLAGDLAVLLDADHEAREPLLQLARLRVAHAQQACAQALRARLLRELLRWEREQAISRGEGKGTPQIGKMISGGEGKGTPQPGKTIKGGRGREPHRQGKKISRGRGREPHRQGKR